MIRKKTSIQLLECISIRLAHWASEETLFKGITVDNLIRNLHNVINYSPLVTPMDIRWCPLVVNALKLNFDGSSIGNMGPSGIGGTIIDNSGSCLVTFSGPLSMGDALSAELKVFLCGVKLIHSKGLSSHKIEVE